MRDRETRGVVASTKRFIVSEDQILSLKNRPLYEFPTKPDVLYTAIDPSGGGLGSDYAIKTMALSHGVPVVS